MSKNLEQFVLERARELNPKVANLDEALFEFALSAEEVNAIKFTMLAGANCDVRNDFGYAPGVIAIFEEKPVIFRTILEGGGNPDIADNRGRTLAMHIVLSDLSSEKKIHMLDALKQFGADFTKTDCTGRTVKDYAQTNYHQEVIHYLDERGRPDLPS
jgi:ankyrin repeat protein